MTHPVGDTLNQYKQVHTVTPANIGDLKTFFETTMQDDHAVVFGNGDYVCEDYIFYRHHNTHWFAENSSYEGRPNGLSLVTIRAPFRIEGAEALRMTGIDFYHTDNKSCFFSFGGSVFMSDCGMSHFDFDPPTWGGGGGAWSGYGTRLSIEPVLRHNDINFAADRVSGVPIKMKDGGYLRMAASTNGWFPRVYNGGPIAAIQLYGTPGYLHDVVIYGPGKLTGIPGVLVGRGVGVEILQTLGVPAINKCGFGLYAISANIFIRGAGHPIRIADCHTGIAQTGGGKVWYDSPKDFKMERVNAFA